MASGASDGKPGAEQGFSGHPLTMPAIGGPTGRTVQLNTTVAPWRMICSLRIGGPNGLYFGTGWLAGPSLVVTAGHCVFSQARFGGWAQSVTVSPGRTPHGAPYGEIEGVGFHCAQGWESDEDLAYDIGAIFLPQALGDQNGWFGLASPDDMSGQAVSVAGYPDFAGSHDNLLSGDGAIAALQGGRLFYDVETDEGESGGPVWTLGADGAPVAVAVHAYGADETPPELGAAHSGAALSAELIELIGQWRSQA